MNRKNARFRYAGSLLLLLFAGATSSALAQGTAFSYQGRLQDSGANANSNYDFQFTLWDALNGGTQQPQPTPVTVTKSGVAVANGVFTVQLDFGATAFPGADRWLETSVRLAGGGAFTVLSPRQPITSTPYAVRSASSSSSDVATTATNATQLGGVAANQYVVTTDARMSDPRPPTAGSANYIQNTTSQQASSNFNISGNGVIGASLITNGSVAIGTTIPTARLLVAQSTAGTGSVSIVAGSTTVSGTSTQFTTFFHVGDTIAVAGTAVRTITAISSNTSLIVSSSFSTTANGLSYTLFNGTSLAVSVDGKVGIGTASPSYKFHVLVQNDSTAAGNFQSSSPTGFSNGLLVTAGTNANDVSFWSRDQAGNSLLMVRGDGNVGIGTGAPGSALEVRRNATVASDWQTGQLRISGATDPNMQLNLGYDTSSNVGVIQAGQANTGYTNLFLNPLGGSVAIGLTGGPFIGLPKLYVKAGDDQYGVIGSATNFPGVRGVATTGDGVTGDSQSGRGVNGSSSTGAGVVGTSGTFGVNGGAGLPSQNFGAAYVGKAAVWGTSQSSVGVFGTSDSNVGVVGVSQSNIGVLGRSITGTAGRFEGNVVITGTLTQGSDARLKQGISNLSYGLAEVRQLRPVTWRWKDHPDRGNQLGLVAQEVEKVLPELVSTEKDPRQTKGINYIGLAPVMIKAIQEQQAQIEQQQELIKQQQALFKKQRAILAVEQQQIEALKKLVCRSHRRAVVCR